MKRIVVRDYSIERDANGMPVRMAWHGDRVLLRAEKCELEWARRALSLALMSLINQRYGMLLFIVFLLAPCAAAQRSVDLSGLVPGDATPASTYNVYRSPGPCPVPLPAMTRLANVAAVRYTDFAATIGTWCYYVTQLRGGVESPYSPSNTNFVTVTVPRLPRWWLPAFLQKAGRKVAGLLAVQTSAASKSRKPNRTTKG